MAVMKLRMYLEASVLPAPDSPLIRIHWSWTWLSIFLYDSLAIANLCVRNKRMHEKNFKFC